MTAFTWWSASPHCRGHSPTSSGTHLIQVRLLALKYDDVHYALVDGHRNNRASNCLLLKDLFTCMIYMHGSIAIPFESRAQSSLDDHRNRVLAQSTAAGAVWNRQPIPAQRGEQPMTGWGIIAYSVVPFERFWKRLICLVDFLLNCILLASSF